MMKITLLMKMKNKPDNILNKRNSLMMLIITKFLNND